MGLFLTRENVQEKALRTKDNKTIKDILFHPYSQWKQYFEMKSVNKHKSSITNAC